SGSRSGSPRPREARTNRRALEGPLLMERRSPLSSPPVDHSRSGSEWRGIADHSRSGSEWRGVADHSRSGSGIRRGVMLCVVVVAAIGFQAGCAKRQVTKGEPQRSNAVLPGANRIYPSQQNAQEVRPGAPEAFPASGAWGSQSRSSSTPSGSSAASASSSSSGSALSSGSLASTAPSASSAASASSGSTGVGSVGRGSDSSSYVGSSGA